MLVTYSTCLPSDNVLKLEDNIILNFQRLVIHELEVMNVTQLKILLRNFYKIAPKESFLNIGRYDLPEFEIFVIRYQIVIFSLVFAFKNCRIVFLKSDITELLDSL